MSHLQELQRLLKPYFKLSSARLECLCHMIIGLLAVNNVNLAKIAKSFCSNTLTASSYKRTQRFLKGLNWSSSWLWDLIEACCELKGNLHLALDRTNWKFGKLNINILTLAVCYRGIAIPFVWLMLQKQGNSCWQERCEVLKRLVSVISKERIAALLTDREFVGKEWLKALTDMGMPFVVRTRENICIANTKGIMLPASLMFRGVKVGKYVAIPSTRKIMGCQLYVVATRLPTNELLILLTNQQPELAFDRYRLRWNIETLFSALKKRGFNFESTHLVHEERISNLLFVMTIALLMGIRQGEFLEAEKPSKIKKHGYVAEAIFKRGLEYLGKLIFNLTINMKAFYKAISAIFKPIKPRAYHHSLSGSVL